MAATLGGSGFCSKVTTGLAELGRPEALDRALQNASPPISPTSFLERLRWVTWQLGTRSSDRATAPASPISFWLRSMAEATSAPEITAART